MSARRHALGALFVCAAISACTDPDNGGGTLSVPDAGQITTLNGDLGPNDTAHPAPFNGLPGSASDAATMDDAGMDAAPTRTEFTTSGDANGDTYALDLVAGQSVQIVMCRAGDNSVLDPYLIVDFNGTHVLADDDSAGDLDARIQLDAMPPGRYTIIATVATQMVALSGNHAYTLRVAITDPLNPLGCQ